MEESCESGSPIRSTRICQLVGILTRLRHIIKWISCFTVKALSASGESIAKALIYGSVRHIASKIFSMEFLTRDRYTVSDRAGHDEIFSELLKVKNQSWFVALEYSGFCHRTFHVFCLGFGSKNSRPGQRD